MELELKRNSGFDVVFTSDNTKVTEDVEERIYPLKEDGSKDFSKPPLRDISTNVLESLVSFFDDIVYFRQREFDGSELIKRLFEKLPPETANTLSEQLRKDYEFQHD